LLFYRAALDLRHALRIAQRKAFVVLDGTLTPIDRLSGTNDRLYYSGKHRRHGVNIQFLTDPHGELTWASPALPGSVHDLTAAREHGIVDGLRDPTAAAPRGLPRGRTANRPPHPRRRTSRAIALASGEETPRPPARPAWSR
jgi:DDE superfamily endonuclease